MDLRRSTSAVLAVGAAVVVIGCGGSGDSDRDRVVKTLRSYGNAMVNGKYGKACDVISEKSKVAMEKAGTGCLDAMLLYGRSLGKSQKEGFQNMKVKTVEVSGNRAILLTRAGSRPAHFIKVDGDWYLDEDFTKSSAAGESSMGEEELSDQELIDGRITANYEGSGNTPILDPRHLDAALATALSKQMSAGGTEIFASVSCPEHIGREANYSFTCDGTAADSDATFTVEVKFIDDNGNYIYSSYM